MPYPQGEVQSNDWENCRIPRYLWGPQKRDDFSFPPRMEVPEYGSTPELLHQVLESRKTLCM